MNNLRLRENYWEKYRRVLTSTPPKTNEEIEFDFVLLAYSLDLRLGWLGGVLALGNSPSSVECLLSDCRQRLACIDKRGDGNLAHYEIVIDASLIGELTTATRQEMNPYDTNHYRYLDETFRWLETRQVLMDIVMFHEFAHFYLEHLGKRAGIATLVKEEEADALAGFLLGHFYVQEQAEHLLQFQFSPLIGQEYQVITPFSIGVQPNLVLAAVWLAQFSAWPSSHPASSFRQGTVVRAFRCAIGTAVIEWDAETLLLPTYGLRLRPVGKRHQAQIEPQKRNNLRKLRTIRQRVLAGLLDQIDPCAVE